MLTDNIQPARRKFLLEGCAIDPLLDDLGFAKLVGGCQMVCVRGCDLSGKETRL